MKEKTLLFSVTKKDFDIQFTRGTGKGGQNRNKVETACRITHPDSGAVGYSETERTQLANKKIAFDRLFRSKEFQQWHKIKTSWALQGIINVEREIERLVNEAMNLSNIKTEIKVDGKWVEVDNDWFENNKETL